MVSRTGPRPVSVSCVDQERSKTELSDTRKDQHGEQKGMIMRLDERHAHCVEREVTAE